MGQPNAKFCGNGVETAFLACKSSSDFEQFNMHDVCMRSFNWNRDGLSEQDLDDEKTYVPKQFRGNAKGGEIARSAKHGGCLPTPAMLGYCSADVESTYIKNKGGDVSCTITPRMRGRTQTCATPVCENLADGNNKNTVKLKSGDIQVTATKMKCRTINQGETLENLGAAASNAVSHDIALHAQLKAAGQTAQDPADMCPPQSVYDFIFGSFFKFSKELVGWAEGCKEIDECKNEYPVSQQNQVVRELRALLLDGEDSLSNPLQQILEDSAKANGVTISDSLNLDDWGLEEVGLEGLGTVAPLASSLQLLNSMLNRITLSKGDVFVTVDPMDLAEAEDASEEQADKMNKIVDQVFGEYMANTFGNFESMTCGAMGNAWTTSKYGSRYGGMVPRLVPLCTSDDEDKCEMRCSLSGPEWNDRHLDNKVAEMKTQCFEKCSWAHQSEEDELNDAKNTNAQYLSSQSLQAMGMNMDYGSLTSFVDPNSKGR